VTVDIHPGGDTLAAMARTPSTMVPLGTPAPDFDLPDTTGHRVALRDFADAPALLVVFMCNHCPYVKHVAAELARLSSDYRPRGLAMVGINSNDADNYPEDSPAKMREEVELRGYEFPYLFDASQSVARAYRAACTPDFFLFDGRRELVYRGQLDDSRPGNGVAVTGRDLRAAIDAVLAGEKPSESQVPSMGCGIKWK
jgi:peroxiredoxin